MLSSLVIANREFKGFFGSPLGWIAACILFLVSGIVFFIVVQVLLLRGSSIDPTGDILGQILGFLNYINIFVVPAFTMRTITEDLANGTYRLQACAPISDWSIVLGKFLSVLFYFGALGICLLLYPLFALIFTQPDVVVMFCGWFGLLLNTASIIAIGMFVSSLTKNPVISYLGSAFFIILFIFSAYLPGAPEWYKHSANLLELTNDFTRGIIKTSSVTIYLALIVVFLSLTKFVVECKKWRI